MLVSISYCVSRSLLLVLSVFMHFVRSFFLYALCLKCLCIVPSIFILSFLVSFWVYVFLYFVLLFFLSRALSFSLSSSSSSFRLRERARLPGPWGPPYLLLGLSGRLLYVPVLRARGA